MFGKTELGLQHAMILASAIVMGADALASKDEDFGRAFNAGAEALVWELAGKPLALDGAEPVLVPGQHLLAVMDAHSSSVCEVCEMCFFGDSLPNGVTSELVVQMARDYADEVRRTRHLRMPTDDRAGYVDVAIPLADLPDQWKNWTATKGGRTHKKLAPDIAVAFVERPR